MAKKRPPTRSKPKAKPKAKATTPVLPSAFPLPPTTVRYANIFPGRPQFSHQWHSHALPDVFVQAVTKLEAEIKLPVWFIIQDSSDESIADKDSFNMIGEVLANAVFSARHSELTKGQRIAVLIDSRGGMARQAYEIAMLLRRHCGGFVAIIPRHAKSAATLLTLGADEIVMNDHAELGPLDAQIRDFDREEWLSGLDEVQSLERLNAFAMTAMDRMMFTLLRRTGKRARTLLPVVTEFVTKLTQPMFASIDVIRYTQMSRALSVAQAYGKRLLEKTYGNDAAEMARKLVEEYPEHGFPIYPDEASALGLKISRPSGTTRSVLEELARELPNLNVVGRIIP